MRGFAHGAAMGMLAAWLVAPGTAEAQTKDAASVLAAARQALGGEKGVSAVKSLTARDEYGRYQHERSAAMFPERESAR